jgi:hypothetical protein
MPTPVNVKKFSQLLSPDMTRLRNKVSFKVLVKVLKSQSEIILNQYRQKTTYQHNNSHYAWTRILHVKSQLVASPVLLIALPFLIYLFHPLAWYQRRNQAHIAGSMILVFLEENLSMMQFHGNYAPFSMNHYRISIHLFYNMVVGLS